MYRRRDESEERYSGMHAGRITAIAYRAGMYGGDTSVHRPRFGTPRPPHNSTLARRNDGRRSRG